MADRLPLLLMLLICTVAWPLSSAELSAVRVFHLAETSLSVSENGGGTSG